MRGSAVRRKSVTTIVGLLLATMVAPSASPAVQASTSQAASSGAEGDAAAPTPACATSTLEKPVAIRVDLRDGTKLDGRATAFGADGFMVQVSAKKGQAADAREARGASDTAPPEPRAVLWLSVQPDDLERLSDKLIADDKKRPQDQLLKAELLALAGQGNKADRAFDRVLRSNRSLVEEVDASKARARERIIDAEHTERIRLHQLMASSIPSHQGGTPPWPILSRAEHEAAVEAMKRRAQEICATARVNATLVETRYFLLYAAARPEAVQECARSLDAMYERVLELFGIPPGLNLFWGKAVVLLQPNEEAFRVVEAAAFGQMTPPGVVGLCHQVGPQVFVNIFWSDDQDMFDAVLLHEAVHGIMHRYHSPARLPAWADEGLSEYIAAVSFPSSKVDSMRRPQAIEFIRSGGNVAQVMRLSYQDRSWPGPNAVGYAVGYAVVELMIRQQPQRFGRWIRAVKGGKPWEQALTEDFGFTTDQFAATATEWYRRAK